MREVNRGPGGSLEALPLQLLIRPQNLDTAHTLQEMHDDVPPESSTFPPIWRVDRCGRPGAVPARIRRIDQKRREIISPREVFLTS